MLERFETADFGGVTVRQGEAWEGVHTLRLKKRFGEGLDGFGIAAVDEEIVFVGGEIAIDGGAAVEREDSEAGGGLIMEILSAPEGEEQGYGGDAP